jgi:hypothetical protein
VPVLLLGWRVTVTGMCGIVIILSHERGNLMNNYTFCLSCGVVSEGDYCNNCGSTNIVPAHDHDKDGFTCCPHCGAIFKYGVSKCSVCQKGDS